MAAALPLFGAFIVGLAARGWLLQHISLLFRLQFGVGLGLLSVLAGWSFHLSVDNISALFVLLGAQLVSVLVAARVFGGRGTDGPQAALWVIGNPSFWTAPIATATLGTSAAVFIIAYDMLTQARLAAVVRYLRGHAPLSQSARTAIADYAPTIGAISGLLLGRVLPAPDLVDPIVAGLGIAVAIVAFLLLGVSWPQRWIDRALVTTSARSLALHWTLVPALLALATLAGIELPGVIWLLALGPIPTSVVSFAQVYGYSARLAATGLALSFAVAIVLLPLSLSLAR